MLFNSIEFLLFFPAVVLMYYLIPGKLRMYWLLVTSYVFYMCWNPSYALLLLFSTAVTFCSGLLIGRTMNRREAGERVIINEKIWIALSFGINLSILFFFKYFDFMVDNINALRGSMGLEQISPGFDVLLPVGISFYIFQALSYTMDVYRRQVRVEKNFFKYATFVSFFPQLVAGPIERSSHLLTQFDKPQPFRFSAVRDGLMLMIWGFFQKIVIADRAAIVVNQIFNYSSYYSGFELLIGMVLFAVQVYGDFAGYSSIAIGAAQVMGFDLMENFRRPYFATSVADFWRRWHISLSTWFRDYLYIPLGGSRKGRARRYINVMIVFLCSGLWHGAAWNYVIWGALNGLYQVIGSLLKPLREKLMRKVGMRTETFSHRLLQMLLTFVLIDLSWVFFRANTVNDAFGILSRLFVWNPEVLLDGRLLRLGFDAAQWATLGVSLAVLLGVSVLQECGVHLRETLNRQEAWFRWMVVIASVLAVLVLGIYGPSFDASAFIYFQF
ncbi:MAG: MBOAT family protein [Clostridiales bacterium]|nr:MBOAT family protein [Clostridiales bacterium]